MPEGDFIKDKVSDLRSRFGIIDSVSGTVGVIEDFFETVANGVPPKIEIHLNKADSKYDYGEVAYALDMTWYAKYKPTVDTILSSMMWLFFVWRVFVKLPSLIGGVSGDVETASLRKKGGS